MLYNYTFDIAAVILTAMLIYIVLIRRTYPSKTCTIYKWILWLNLISALSDLASAFTISYATTVPLWVNYVVNITYLEVHNLNAIAFLLYVIVLIRGNFGKKREKAFIISVVVIDSLLIFTSPLTKLVFYFDEEFKYSHGYGLYVLYVFAISVMLYSLYLFIRNRTVLSKFQMATNIVFLILLLSAVIYQAFYPTVLIESFCCSISFMMMNVALDNPANYFYRETFCYNQNAFNETVENALASGKQMTFLSFTFDDRTIFKKKFGEKAYKELIDYTIELCHKNFGQKKVYLLSNAYFVIDVSDSPNIEEGINLITNTFAKNVPVGNERLSVPPHFAICRCPGCSNSVSDVNDMIVTMLTDVHQKTGQRVIYDTPDILESRHFEANVVHILHNAIATGAFDVYFQPIYNVHENRYVSAEALVRLKLPENSPFKFIGPSDFITIAERNGMIFDISEIVFQKVCRFWRDAKLGELGLQFVEVNMSMLELLDGKTLDYLAELCKRYNIPPKSIKIEITETSTAGEENQHLVHKNINRMTALGFEFILDDYGSGYSTAGYIAEMPVNIIKIDRSILWNSTKSPASMAVLRNCIHFAHSLDKLCVAEGVENQEFVDILKTTKCDYFQGYYYSKPLPLDEFVAFMKSQQENHN